MSAATGSKLATGWLELTVSTKGAQESIVKDVTGAGQRSGDNLGAQILGGLKKAAGPIAAVVAGFSIAKLVSDSQQKFMELAGTTRTLARVAGGTTEQVSGLAGGMRMAGLDSDKAQVAINMFSKNLGNANDGGEKTSAMIAKLGGDFRDAQGNVKPLAEIMPMLADKFQSMPNGAEKTALAMQLFGRSGATVIPFLNNGAAGIAEFTAKAKTMGLVLDDTSLKIWANAKASTRDFKAAVDGAKGSLGQNLTPVLVGFQNVYRQALIPVLQGASTWLNNNRDRFIAVGGAIDGFATRLSGAVSGIVGLFTTGDVSGGLLRSLGLEEDSAAIGVLLRIRDAAITTGNVVGAAFRGIGAAIKVLATGNVDGGILKALGVEEDSAAIGVLLGIRDTVGQVFTAIGATLGNVFGAIGPVFGQIFAALGPIIPQLLELWSSLSPVQLILQALTPVLPEIAALLGQLAGTIGGVLGQVLAALLPPLAQVAQVLVAALVTAFQMLMPVITALLPVVGQIVAALGGALGQVIAALAPILVQVVGFIAQLVPVILPVITAVLGLVSPLLQLISPLLQLIGPILTPVIQLLSALLVPILALIQPIIGLLVPVLQVVAQVLAVVIGWIAEAINWFVNFVTGQQEAGDQFRAVWDGIVGFFAGVGQTIAGIWDGFLRGVGQFVGGVIGFFQSIPQRIGEIFAGAGTWLFNTGRDLIDGLLSGAQGVLRNIGEFFLSIVPGWIVEPFKAALGIHSPSRVFAGFGVNTMEGYVEGLRSMSPAVQAAAATVGTLRDPSQGPRDVPPWGADESGGAVATGQQTFNIHSNDPNKVATVVADRLRKR